MPYTTSDLVEAVLAAGDDYGGADLTIYIRTADTWIRQMLACAAAKDPPYVHTEEDIEVIATWLAAHAYVMSDQTYAAKNTDRSGGQFKNRVGPRFELSNYGSTALGLDGSRCLEAINNPQKNVGAFWGGKNPSSQIDYTDR
jgi:hypothetical protein